MTWMKPLSAGTSASVMAAPPTVMVVPSLVTGIEVPGEGVLGLVVVVVTVEDRMVELHGALLGPWL